MRLKSEFIRLPLRFDVDRLREEALQFSEYEWDYHPQRYDGNTALNLVSKEGSRSNAYVGRMQATDALERCPYIQQIMASLNTVVGRSRFMRLAPGKGVPAHSDTDYTWRNRVRIHIPIITDPSIEFVSRSHINGKVVKVHKQAGEAWIFDNWREHEVINESDIQRIHLVIDTVGTRAFWQMTEQGYDPSSQQPHGDSVFVPFDPHKEQSDIKFEQFNRLAARSPDEIEALVKDYLDEIDSQRHADAYTVLEQQLKGLCQDWRGLWARFLDTADGHAEYLALIKHSKSVCQAALDEVFLNSNGAAAYPVLENWLDNAIDSEVQVSATSGASYSVKTYSGKIPSFDQPVFIVAAPRSGSTMLFEALKNNKDLWSIGDEAHQEIESIAALHPKSRDFASNRLDATDYSPEVGEQIIDGFMYRLQNSRCATYADMPPEFQSDQVRFLEKTPKNALRIPFFKAMYPDAKFVFLHRAAEPNIASMIEAWRSGKFVTYPDLPHWQGDPWSLLLIDAWQQLTGRPLVEIVATQWAKTNTQIVSDLTQLDAAEVMSLSYEALLNNTHTELERVCHFMQVPFGPKMRSYASQGFPNSKYALTQPDTQKWRKHEAALASVAEIYQPVSQLIDEFVQSDSR